MAVMFVDLDRFKQVNDSLGHRAGDELLVEVARRLVGCVRETDTVGRLGGDEFVMVLSQSGDLATTSTVGERVLSAVNQPVVLQGQQVHVSASVGISLYPTHGEDAETLLKNADIAMYAAKSRGKHRVHIFHDELASVATRRLQVESRVRDAWAREVFSFDYQPVYDVSTGALRSVEALVRWREADGTSPMSPAEFLPVFEEIGIHHLTSWAIDRACAQVARWRTDGVVVPRVAVNVTPAHLENPDFAHQTLHTLLRHGLAPQDLEIEITESGLVMPGAGRVLEALAGEGVHVALDDFGTGYSGLSSLRDFPFSTIKIDRSFVATRASSRRQRSLVKTMVLMGVTLGLEVVAEGVEAAEQLQFLREIGVSSVQGFLLGRPAPPAISPAPAARIP